MMEYRERIEIIGDFLASIGKGSRKTRIMMRTNLSYAGLVKYLGKVVNCGLVIFDGGKRLYVTTRKGDEFLEQYNEYSRSKKRLAKLLENLENKEKELNEMLTPVHDKLTVAA